MSESRTARYVRHLVEHVFPVFGCWWCELEKHDRIVEGGEPEGGGR